MKNMTISELARNAGNPTLRTIRFYEEEGMLKPSLITKGGQKRYGTDALLNLKRIQLLKKTGLSLKEIKRTIIQLSRKSSTGRMKQKACLRVLDESREKLLRCKREITDLIKTMDKALANKGKCDRCNPQDCAGCGTLDKWTRFGY